MQKQIILIAGGSCSGKSVFATLFQHAVILSMDHFYLPKNEVPHEPDGSVNYDSPKVLDLNWCKKAALELKSSGTTTIPVYDMVTSDRTGTQTIDASDDTKFIVIEGLFTLHEPLLSIGDVKIFIDTPPEIRVARRMIRDTQKGRSHTDTLAWSINVENNHRLYVEPTKQNADIVVPFSYNPVQFQT
jgi:uridine kinase